MTIKVTYIAPFLDASGYAEASRNNMLALQTAGVRVYGKSLSFEKFKCYQGKHTEAINKMMKDKISSDIQILHVTPEHYSKLCNSSKYNIGYAAWEATRLPDKWIPQINLLNEIWVPSEFCVKAFKDSGVTIPVKRIPHAFDTEPEEIVTSGPVIKNRKAEDFAFYSIFQWLERKNPTGLLKAYLTEFKKEGSSCIEDIPD